MNISKRAEDKLLKRVPENHVVRYRHYRLPEGTGYDYPDTGPIWKRMSTFGSSRLIMESAKVLPTIDGVYSNGGRTICTIEKTYPKDFQMLERGTIVARGEALCSFSDQFCKRVGRTIALGRALTMLEDVS